MATRLFGNIRRRMKTVTITVLALVLLAAGCATASRRGQYGGTTGIAVSGTSGAILTGFYFQDGRRVAISNAVPWSLEVPRLSSLELRKVHPAEAVVVDLRYESDGVHAQLTKALGSGVVGVRAKIRDGLMTTAF